jgi:hypothetical protein
MNITRNNYEEYFILYMDNELTQEERGMVEAFVQLHPDLKEELELLLQYKFTPDTDIVFSGKEELLKGQAESIVNLSNYEEYLLLYIDNELNPAQAVAVEQFAAENLAVKKELDLLRFTRLQPETIVFPDKASLYRKEEKVRALPVRWWRSAAAILILGLGLTTLWMTNRKTDDSLAAGKNDTKGSIKTPAPIQPAADNDALANGADTTSRHQATGMESLAETKTTTPGTNGQSNVKQQPNKQYDQPQPDKTDALANNQQQQGSNNLPKPVNNPNLVNPQQDIAVNPVSPNNNTKGILTKNDVTNTTGSSPDIKQAVDFAVNRSNDMEIETETAGNDGKKNKLRGFFRKVTRTFEKRTNIDPTDQDDRLLVGGLAIKLK